MSEPSQGRSLPWYRVDVDLVDHPKVRGVGGVPMKLITLGVAFAVTSAFEAGVAAITHLADAPEAETVFIGVACLCVALSLACLCAAVLLREVGR